MLAMSSASGRGKPSRSASSIVADRSVGYHDLKIDGSALTAGAPAARLVTSCPFTVGGHRWRISLDPTSPCGNYLSLYLVLDETVDESVTAQVQFSIVREKRALFFIKREKVCSTSTKLRSFATGGRLGCTLFATWETLGSMARHGGGSVTIRCDITVFNAFRAAAPAAHRSSSKHLDPVPPPELQKHLGDLLQSGRGADVVFEVDGGERIPAHRCILSARSAMISAELLGGGGKTMEGGGIVRVEGVEAPVLRALMRFAYTDALPAANGEEDQPGAMYADLLAAADRFGLERLKMLCANELCERIDVGAVKTILTLAERHRCDGLKAACLDFLADPANLRAAIATHGL